MTVTFSDAIAKGEVLVSVYNTNISKTAEYIMTTIETEMNNFWKANAFRHMYMANVWHFLCTDFNEFIFNSEGWIKFTANNITPFHQ